MPFSEDTAFAGLKAAGELLQGASEELARVSDVRVSAGGAAVPPRRDDLSDVQHGPREAEERRSTQRADGGESFHQSAFSFYSLLYSKIGSYGRLKPTDLETE